MSTPVTLDFSNGWHIDAAPGSGPTQAAAQELAEHLALIAPQSEGQSGIRMSLAYRDQATDGFIWNVAEGHVQLTGNSERGLLYAIFSFLTQLGFGWPGHEIEDRHIPSGLRFSLPEACAETPSFEGRCLIIGHHVFLTEHEAWIKWAARNCLNTVFVHTAEEGLALGAAPVHPGDGGRLPARPAQHRLHPRRSIAVAKLRRGPAAPGRDGASLTAGRGVGAVNDFDRTTSPALGNAA